MARALALAVFNTLFLFVGCAGNGDRSGAQQGQLKVALITPGPISDQAWNGGAYKGLLAIRDSLGAKISNIETDTPSGIEESFRQYGAEGYDLVFGHGSEFQDPAVRVGPSFPKTTFAVTSGNQAKGNVVGIAFAFDEGSYVAGMIAAAVTKSKTIGCIGGTELPPVKTSFDAFAAGARAIDPAVRVLTGYIGSWNDVTAGKEHALAQIGRGADVIFGNADAAGLGIFQAARENGHVMVIGANSDQTSVAPEVVLGSVVIDLPRAMLSIARDVAAHKVGQGLLTFGAKTDVVRWVYNPALQTRVSARVRARVDSVVASQHAGTFTVPPAVMPAK